MTLDTLLSDFDAAVMRAQSMNREDLPAWAHRRAGLVAVLERLRTNMVLELEREELAEILGGTQ